MKRLFSVTLATILLLSLFPFAGSVSTVSAKESKIMEFDSMVGVPSALTGIKAPIRGFNGGGAPWMISSASGELTASGHLEIEVQGLVLVSNSSNPLSQDFFRGLVSCIKSDGTIENILTEQFPATTGLASLGGGNAEIEADLILPQPCIAPIIFVTNKAGTSWFATIGF